MAQRGTVSLCMDKETASFLTEEGQVERFPFAVTLHDFRIVNYPGTDAPMDYVSTLYCPTTDDTLDVSMNNIATIRGYRFYQSQYDDDMQGCTMLVSYDPWGIGITYTFYLTLLLSIVGIIVTRFRSHLRLSARTAAMVMMLMMSVGTYAQDGSAPAVASNAMNEVAVLYNGRIYPLNTAATDFVTKLTGKPSWNGYSAEEIFLGWMIYYDDWERQPLVKVKSAEVQRIIGIDGRWASLRDFYTSDGKYKLQSPLAQNPTDKNLREADEKVRLVSMFYSGEFLKIFPFDGSWYSPGSTSLPRNIPEREFQFIKHAMDQWVQAVLDKDETHANILVEKIKNYQHAHADIPSTLTLEVIYNKILAQRWAVYLFLTLSLLLCIVGMVKTTRSPYLHITALAVGISQLIYLTVLIVMRWIISGHVPLSNGFETMQFLSWVLTLLWLVIPAKKAHVLLVSSFAMLVSVIANGSPQVTPLMPVLHSPLLTLHVLCVMLAYAIFALQAIEAAAGLTRCASSCSVQNLEVSRHSLTTWNLMGVLMLTIGIFLGAVWANVSWGRYWGWDPKETWALITLMIYAVPLHPSLIPLRGKAFHWYILLAFLSVLMTYFGVNYLLPGMHSYA